MENVGCDVSKAYLQHERHSHIHYDNDDQCHAPVVGNTHNLRGAGRALNATPHTHTVSTNITQPLLHLRSPVKWSTFSVSTVQT